MLVCFSSKPLLLLFLLFHLRMRAIVDDRHVDCRKDQRADIAEDADDKSDLEISQQAVCADILSVFWCVVLRMCLIEH